MMIWILSAYLQEELDRAIAERRIDEEQVKLKKVTASSNKLLERRRQKKTSS